MAKIFDSAMHCCHNVQVHRHRLRFPFDTHAPRLEANLAGSPVHECSSMEEHSARVLLVGKETRRGILGLATRSERLVVEHPQAWPLFLIRSSLTMQ